MKKNLEAIIMIDIGIIGTEKNIDKWRYRYIKKTDIIETQATSWQISENPPLNMGKGEVIRIGFEPMTYSLEGCRSIQLSYRTFYDVFP